MERETAGDPMTGLKWTRKTTKKIAHELQKLGINVCATTVGKILKKLGYSLRVNHKKISSGTGPDRNKQFELIASNRKRFNNSTLPIISVDTKKKELIGNFKNHGKAWEKQAVAVNDHDFPSSAIGKAVPYGIYDLQQNRGVVVIGKSYDTSQFAVSSIGKWWQYNGRYQYENAKELLILADCGGSNGYRIRAWKYELQNFCDRSGLTITVNHYPPGASKWNPIEHRLFSEISKNWAGRPLTDFSTIKNYISTTSTSTGLTVKAYLDTKIYTKGIKISDEQISKINIIKHDSLPNWNYTISPSKNP